MGRQIVLRNLPAQQQTDKGIAALETETDYASISRILLALHNVLLVWVACALAEASRSARLQPARALRTSVYLMLMS